MGVLSIFPICLCICGGHSKAVLTLSFRACIDCSTQPCCSI